MRAVPIVAVFVALLSGAAAKLQTCGGAQYDPKEYICYNGNFLCAVIAGEPLLRCGDACYSPYQYTCSGSALAQLPASNKPVKLTVSNPAVPAVHGQPVIACGRYLRIGGTTCSYCPSPPVPKGSCPAGKDTVLLPPGGMAVSVPGGQQYYLDAYWSLGYTQAHSASMPSGYLVGGTIAHVGGGFVNVNEGALGWRACPSTASGGGGGQWTLRGANSTNLGLLKNCYAVNLVVKELPTGTVGAWQYT